MSDQLPNPDTPNPPERTPETLKQVQELIKDRAQRLLFCQPQQVPALQQEIQRLRIVASLFREIEDGIQDTDLYKEMNLLNRMMTGKDLESEAIRKSTDEGIAAARGKLEQSYGVSEASANRIARAIANVAGRTDVGGEDPGEPVPIDPSKLH